MTQTEKWRLLGTKIYQGIFSTDVALQLVIFAVKLIWKINWSSDNQEFKISFRTIKSMHKLKTMYVLQGQRHHSSNECKVLLGR